ncbi:Sugar/inositol transporter protein [Dioscorea alata]|uniref:Sugar/inositol transporter protein n=1 Tax=Dioscorea alata TaxID=55571 RepID=A0ACB7V4W1_DIOAL|nr:Sugar/inositol transporter protein [Dioscorea alata]
MAVGFDVSGATTSVYNGRMTIFVVMSCLMAAMGGLIFGYDIGISGGVTSMESFLKKFFPVVYRNMKEDSTTSNYCKFDSQILTAFTSSLYIAGLFASFLASWVTRAFGRKTSMFSGGVAFLIGSAISGASVNVYMLILGRVFLGIGVGFANQSVPLYLSEMAPAQYRGAFSNGFQFSIGVGGLAANLINYGTQKIRQGWGWRLSLCLAAVPATLLIIGALLLPDTPNSLLQHEIEIDKAKQLLQRIRGTDDVDDELNDLIKASEISKTMRHPFRKILRREYRPQLVMAIALPFFQQVTGINVIAFYSPVLFRTIGLVDKFGRRALFIIGGIQMFVTQVMVGGIIAAKLGDQGGISKGYALLVLILICIYVAGFGWSWGPLGWLVPSEIFQLEIRSAAQSITVADG